MVGRIKSVVLSVLSVALAVTLFLIGVFAATSADAYINNIFRFEVDPEDFFVEILGEVTGYVSDKPIENYVHNYQNAAPENFVKWDELNLAFAEENGVVQDIVFTFRIKNHHEDRKIKAEIIDLTNPPSTKVVKLIDQPIILHPIDKNTGQIYYDDISVRIKVVDTTADFIEHFKFRLQFSVVE